MHTLNGSDTLSHLVCHRELSKFISAIIRLTWGHIDDSFASQKVKIQLNIVHLVKHTYIHIGFQSLRPISWSARPLNFFFGGGGLFFSLLYPIFDKS